MIVTVGSPEDVDGLVIVLDGLIELFQTFFRISQVSQALSDLNALSLALSVLFDD